MSHSVFWNPEMILRGSLLGEVEAYAEDIIEDEPWISVSRNVDYPTQDSGGVHRAVVVAFRQEHPALQSFLREIG